MESSLFGTAASTLAKRTYPAAFRQQLVELVREGRSPELLAKEFEPRAQTIRNWWLRPSVMAGPARMG